jgi:hypothetical protein
MYVEYLFSTSLHMFSLYSYASMTSCCADILKQIQNVFKYRLCRNGIDSLLSNECVKEMRSVNLYPPTPYRIDDRHNPNECYSRPPTEWHRNRTCTTVPPGFVSAWAAGSHATTHNSDSHSSSSAQRIGRYSGMYCQCSGLCSSAIYAGFRKYTPTSCANTPEKSTSSGQNFSKYVSVLARARDAKPSAVH